MPIALRKIEDEIELRGGPLWDAIERERESRVARAPETKPVVSMSSKLLELFNDDDFILGAMQAVAAEDDSLWDGPTIKMAVNFAESTYNKYSSIISEREYGEERFWVALVITAVCLGKPNFAKNLKGGLIERTFVGEDLLNKLIEKVLTTPDIIDKVKAKLEKISTKTEALEALENQVKENKNMQNIVETKRETKRYYVRPQNIFCANKADILNALIKVGTDNCSVYSLKRLEDHDDVHLLSPKDIIYYYDDGILYDKNHVKVMDYDLFVKHEEDRKKLANPNTVSDAVFDNVYKDRLTETLGAEGYRVALADYDSDDYDINYEFGFVDDDEYEQENEVVDQEFLLQPGQTMGDLVVYLSRECGYTSISVHDERKATKDEISTLQKFDTVPGDFDYNDYGSVETDDIEVIDDSPESFAKFIAGVNKGEEWLVGYNYDDSDKGYTVAGKPYSDTMYYVTKDEDSGKYILSAYLTNKDNNEELKSETEFADTKELLSALLKIKFNECYIDFSDALIDEAFKLDYKPINALGESYDDKHYTCCICGEEFDGYGNNPAPVKEDGRCCDACNRKFVIPARLEQMGIRLDKDED